MKSLFVIFFLLIPTILLGQTLDEILEKHFDAVGIEYLKNVQTIQYKGYYYNRFLEKLGSNPREKLLKPDFTRIIEKGIGYRQHFASDPGEFIIGYYKGIYWINQNGTLNDPWNPGVADRQIIQEAIDLNGFLYDWKKKGYQVTKLDDAVLDNREYYKIRLAQKEMSTYYFYIDKKTNLISKISYNGDLTDGKEVANIEFQNYRKVGNIYFPFKIIHTQPMLDGSFGEKDEVIKEIKINPKLDNDIFKPTYENS